VSEGESHRNPIVREKGSSISSYRLTYSPKRKGGRYGKKKPSNLQGKRGGEKEGYFHH